MRLYRFRGTDKLKELVKVAAVVERVQQLVSDNEPQVRQVLSLNAFFLFLRINLNNTHFWDFPLFFY